MDVDSGRIDEDAALIHPLIACEPGTPRVVGQEQAVLTALRQKMDAHIKQVDLRRVQAPVGVKATLLAWMEVG